MKPLGHPRRYPPAFGNLLITDRNTQRSIIYSLGQVQVSPLPPSRDIRIAASRLERASERAETVGNYVAGPATSEWRDHRRPRRGMVHWGQTADRVLGEVSERPGRNPSYRDLSRKCETWRALRVEGEGKRRREAEREKKFGALRMDARRGEGGRGWKRGKKERGEREEISKRKKKRTDGRIDWLNLSVEA